MEFASWRLLIPGWILNPLIQGWSSTSKCGKMKNEFSRIFCNVFCWNNYGIIRTKNKPKKLFGQISRWSQFVTKSWLKWCDFYGFKSCPTWHVASILSTLATAKLNKEYFGRRRQKISKVDKSICSWLFLLHSTFFNFISHSEAVGNGESQS